MLITDQSVDLDYLTDPMLSQNGEKVFLASPIKQEETLSEAVSPSSPSSSESPIYNRKGDSEYCYFSPSEGQGYKSRTTSLSEGDDENYRTGGSNSLMYNRNYNLNNVTINSPYSRQMYSPLEEMSHNYPRSPHEDVMKKDDKYWERRRKNNLAAKKSRDSRRIRENQMRLRVLCLENANQMMKEELERKDAEIARLKLLLNKYENCQEMYPQLQPHHH